MYKGQRRFLNFSVFDYFIMLNTTIFNFSGAILQFWLAFKRSLTPAVPKKWDPLKFKQDGFQNREQTLQKALSRLCFCCIVDFPLYIKFNDIKDKKCEKGRGLYKH